MKKIISIFVLLFSFLAFAQQEKLEVTYTSRMILPDDFSFQPRGDGRTMPKEMQEQFKKNIQEPQEAVLTILGDESVYKMVEKISNDQSQILKEQNVMGKSYVIKDSLQNFGWKLTRETKTILGNEAKKATAIIDSVQTTVWYIPTLKYKTGPENYWGLPGLIAEVETKFDRGMMKGTRIISLTDLKTSSSTKTIEKPKDKNTITQKEYNKLMQEQRSRFEEMRNSGVNKRD